MPVEVKGAIALRKALRKFEPDLAKGTQKAIAGHLRALTNRARGFVPSEAPLSGWANSVGEWEYRAFNTGDIKRGLTYSTTPSRPNRSGFRSLASIINKSAAGSIYETAGRKNPQGRPAGGGTYTYFPGGVETIGHRATGKENNRSWNPKAGSQFINSMPELVDSQQSNSPGRRTRKTKGRLIFRAWAEDRGKTTASVAKALEASAAKFNVKRSDNG